MTGDAGAAVRVCLEQGKTWVFATAVDWPGWCRRGKGEHAALDTLLNYASRYAAVAGPAFRPGPRRSGCGCRRARRGREQRAAIAAAFRAGAPDGKWPARYALHRFAWHVLDHA